MIIIIIIIIIIGVNKQKWLDSSSFLWKKSGVRIPTRIHTYIHTYKQTHTHTYAQVRNRPT